MGNVYLLNYAVRGIKTLDQWISLSFYKKTISNDLDLQKYNIKGIYGMNGSGKSGIVTSVNVLGKLLVDQSYLNNPLVQRNLDAIINKKTGELSIEAEFASKVENIVLLHLSDNNSDEKLFKQKVQEATGKIVYIANRNVEIKLGGF